MLKLSDLHNNMGVYYILSPTGQPKKVAACRVEDTRYACVDPDTSEKFYACSTVPDEFKILLRLSDMYMTHEGAEACL